MQICVLQGGDACHDGAIQIQPGVLAELHVCLHLDTAQHNICVLGTW